MEGSDRKFCPLYNTGMADWIAILVSDRVPIPLWLGITLATDGLDINIYPFSLLHWQRLNNDTV